MTQEAHRETHETLREIPRIPPSILSLVPPTIVAEPVLSFARDILEQPVQDIAKALNKKVQELTASDVLLYTYANLPTAMRKASFDMMEAQVMAWQTMLTAVGAYHRIPRNGSAL
jgi:hypothetical protein